MKRSIFLIMILFVLSPVLAFAGMSTGNGSVSFYTDTVTLTNATNQNLIDATDGFLSFGDGTNSGLVQISADGSVNVIGSTGTVEATDTGVGLAIYDGGTNATIKNRTGSNATVDILYMYLE